MALIEETLFGTVDKVQIAIDRLKAFEPADGYWLAFSGGKDSVVIKRLAQMAGVKFEAHYSVTSVDHPPLVQFIKKAHPDISRDIPRDDAGEAITMWNLIPKKSMPPTRIVRYCCEKLKESSGKGRVTVTGVRWAESNNRKRNQGSVTFTEKGIGKVVSGFTENFTQTNRGGVVLNLDNDEARRVVEQCYRTTKTLLNPIIDWTDADVWEFIKCENIPYCELYDCGYKRLGCVGCPMSTNAENELNAYPKIKESYIRAFDRMLLERGKTGKESKTWKTGEEVMDWWLHGGSNSDDMTLFDESEEEL